MNSITGTNNTHLAQTQERRCSNGWRLNYRNLFTGALLASSIGGLYHSIGYMASASNKTASASTSSKPALESTSSKPASESTSSKPASIENTPSQAKPEVCPNTLNTGSSEFAVCSYNSTRYFWGQVSNNGLCKPYDDEIIYDQNTATICPYEPTSEFLDSILKHGGYVCLNDGREIYKAFYQHIGPNPTNQEAVFSKPENYICNKTHCVSTLKYDETLAGYNFTGVKSSSNLKIGYGSVELVVTIGKEGQVLPPGLFPAPLWLLGEGKWPDNGEVDVELKYDASKNVYRLLFSVHTKDYNHLKWFEPQSQISLPGDIFEPGKSYKLTMINSIEGFQILVNDESVFELPVPENASSDTYPFIGGVYSIEQSHSAGGWMGNNPMGEDCRGIKYDRETLVEMITSSLKISANDTVTLKISPGESFEPASFNQCVQFHHYSIFDHQLDPEYKVLNSNVLSQDSPNRACFTNGNKTVLGISTKPTAETDAVHKNELHTFTTIELPHLAQSCSQEINVELEIYRPADKSPTWNTKPIAAFISYFNETWGLINKGEYVTRKETLLSVIGSNRWVNVPITATVPEGTKHIQCGIKATTNNKNDDSPAIIYLKNMNCSVADIDPSWRKES